jgi:peptidyl-Lys metalloendopeptidase
MKKLGLFLLASAVSVALHASPNRPILETDSIGETNSQLVTSLASNKAYHRASDDVVMKVTYSNLTAAPMQVPAWLLDSNLPDRTFMTVTQAGQPVDYTGALVKRAAIEKQELVTLNPGESIVVEYELTSAFDLSKGGVFDVQFEGSEKHVLGGMSVSSEVVTIGVEANPDRFRQTLISKAAGGGGVTYAANCSSARRSTIATALTSAATYASNSYNYLNVTPSSTKTRYVTWFGTVTTSRWNTVKSHYNLINDAINNKPLSFDCSCTEAGTFAYVYPSQPYKVYFCGAFWAAANTGTDSRAGTIVHELSHFTVLGGTTDHAYGQTAAKNLANTNPKKAIQNADSHEYFSENTPFQN